MSEQDIRARDAQWTEAGAWDPADYRLECVEPGLDRRELLALLDAERAKKSERLSLSIRNSCLRKRMTPPFQFSSARTRRCWKC